MGIVDVKFDLNVRASAGFRARRMRKRGTQKTLPRGEDFPGAFF